MSQTISSAVQWWAIHTPDNTAITIGDDRVTYVELQDWADRISTRLIEMGFEPGHRLGICAGTSLEYCALILGAIRSAGIVMPISARLTTHEIGETLVDVMPALVFADADNGSKFKGSAVRALDLVEIAALRRGERRLPDRELDPEAPVAIISTSGSTARSKGVLFSQRSMTALAAESAMHEPGCFGPGTRTISFAPLSTGGGFIKFVNYAMLGCSQYIESAFDAQRCLRLIVEQKINVLGGVPIFFERMAGCPEFETTDLSSLRMSSVGGAPVSRAMLEVWRRKGVVIRQLYGQTEVGGLGTMMSEKEALDEPEKCGRGGIFTDIRIVGDDGKFCPAGQRGEIVMRGPGVMVGYWNNPEATAEVLRNGWLYTGDIGVLDERGLLTFLDRKKDIIISGGLNISAAEVERAILEFDGIEEAAVIAAKDSRFGETPMAVLYANHTISVQDLVTHCNTRLADFKVPRYVVVLDQPLPRLATGKLSKAALRKQYADAHETLPRVR